MGNAFGYLQTQDNPDPSGDMSDANTDDNTTHTLNKIKVPYVAKAVSFTAPPEQAAVVDNFNASQAGSRYGQNSSYF
tara:strand:+ start:154 stop:384 length:231 start_codon:yes stop_codon:yes gene_type:complete